MTGEELRDQLYEKVSAEQEIYRKWLYGQSAEQALDHASEYLAREDILMELEFIKLTDEQTAALLQLPAPLAELYRQYDKLESSRMDDIADCILEQAAKLLELQKTDDSFTIYQLKDNDETLTYRFESLKRLRAAGLTVKKENYEPVYTAPLLAGATLEDIYRRFNIDRPADFTGHSLSVSDIVVLRRDGQETAHYCDSIGFVEMPEFLREQTSQLDKTDAAEKKKQANKKKLRENIL